MDTRRRWALGRRIRLKRSLRELLTVMKVVLPRSASIAFATRDICAHTEALLDRLPPNLITIYQLTTPSQPHATETFWTQWQALNLDDMALTSLLTGA